MRLRWLLIGLVFLLCLPVTVTAQVFRYTDENGVIHFTDNYIEIPENQRTKAESIMEPVEAQAPEEQAERERSETGSEPAVGDESPGTAGVPLPEGQAEDGQPAEGQGEGPAPAAETMTEAQKLQQFQALNKTKAELDKTYDALAREKETLDKERTTLKTREEIQAFQAKVERFNQRLVDYEKQRQAFQVKADAYNKTVAK